MVYLPGLSTDKNLNSVPIQKYDTIIYSALYRSISILVSSRTKFENPVLEFKIECLSLNSSKPIAYKCIMFPILNV